MIETAPNESTFSPLETGRRRSTFYVPLVSSADAPSTAESPKPSNEQCFSTELKRSLDKIYNPDLSACSFEWSLNDSGDLLVANGSQSSLSMRRTMSTSSTQLMGDNSQSVKNKAKRYGVVLNSINLDDAAEPATNDNCREKLPSNTSTPIKLLKSRSRSNILCLPDKSFQLSPLKEKSKTLPQNLSPKVMSTAASAATLNNHPNGMTHTSTFPPKYSFLLKSSPKILLNYSSDGNSLSAFTVAASPTQSASIVASGNDKKAAAAVAATAVTNNGTSPTSASPRKALSFIRRAHSTKLSRSNSLLKSLTSKCVDQSVENLLSNSNQTVRELSFDRFEECFRSDQFYELIREIFVKDAIVDASATTVDPRVGSTLAMITATSTAAIASGSGTNRRSDADKCDDEVHSGMNLWSVLFHLCWSMSARVLRRAHQQCVISIGRARSTSTHTNSNLLWNCAHRWFLARTKTKYTTTQRWRKTRTHPKCAAKARANAEQNRVKFRGTERKCFMPARSIQCLCSNIPMAISSLHSIAEASSFLQRLFVCLTFFLCV